MAELRCPECGSVIWKAVEQFTALVPCTINETDDGTEPEIEFDSMSELGREAATSITTHYICGDGCGYQVESQRVGELQGGRHGNG